MRNTSAEDDPPCGPYITLRADDQFVCRWSPLMRAHVYVVKQRKVAWLATLLNLYVLISAVRMIESFQPLHVDDYAISELGGPHCKDEAAVSPPAPAASGLTSLLHSVGVTAGAVNKLQLNMASQMERCHAALEARGEKEELRHARVAYWYLFYFCAGVALLVDLARLCGLSSGLGDLFLGYWSPRAEARRFRPMLLALVPLCHLAYFYTAAFRVPCCTATPKLAVALSRVQVLAFLLFISCYCLLADAHNHGYFLLRIADGPRSANRLLRDMLDVPPPRLELASSSEQGLLSAEEKNVMSAFA